MLGSCRPISETYFLLIRSDCAGLMCLAISVLLSLQCQPSRLKRRANFQLDTYKLSADISTGTIIFLSCPPTKSLLHGTLNEQRVLGHTLKLSGVLSATMR